MVNTLWLQNIYNAAVDPDVNLIEFLVESGYKVSADGYENCLVAEDSNGDLYYVREDDGAWVSEESYFFLKPYLVAKKNTTFVIRNNKLKEHHTVKFRRYDDDTDNEFISDDGTSKSIHRLSEFLKETYILV